MARRPDTPDCAVRGCTRAAYRLGLCRGHEHLAPVELSVELTLACFAAQFEARDRVYRKAARLANAAVRAERKAAAPA